MRIEFQEIAYAHINSRFPPESAAWEHEVALLQQELMTILGNAAYLFATQNGLG